nr:serine hydrolase [Salsipaludibacter albus]
METARELMALDATTGQVLAVVNAQERVQVASVIKLLTVLTALDVLDPDQMVTVGDEVNIDGSTAALEPGDTWSVRDLVAGALIRSGNDAAEALAVAGGGGDRAAFIQMMNDKAESLGIVGATIADPSGLEDVNLLSARDLAILGDAALAQPLVAEIANSRSWDLPSTGPVPNRNLLLEMREDATGLKTGTTDLAGASLVGSVRADDHDLVSVIVGARNDNQRYAESVAVFDWIESALDRHPVDVGAAIRLPGEWVGEATTLDLWAPEPPQVDTQLAVDGSSVVSEVSLGVGGRLAEYVATAEVAPPDTIGESLAGKVYEAMRQAHELNTWPSS